MVIFVPFSFDRKAEEPRDCFGGVVTHSVAPDDLVEFPRESLGLGLGKRNSTLENLKAPGILLSSVSEHHD